MLSFGLIVAFCTMLSFAASDTLAKAVSSRTGSKRTTLIMLSSNLVVMAIAGWIFGLTRIDASIVILSALSGAAYALSYFLLYKSLETQQVSNTISLAGIEYGLIALFGVFVLSESVSYTDALAVAGVFCGAFLVTTSKKFKFNRGYMPAITSMFTFAITYFLLIFAQQASGGPLLPLVINRIFAVSLIALHVGRPKGRGSWFGEVRARDAGYRILAMNALMGLFSGVGSILYLVQAQLGIIAVGSAIVAIEPALIIILGYLLYKDRFLVHQLAGLAVLLISTVVLVA